MTTMTIEMKEKSPVKEDPIDHLIKSLNLDNLINDLEGHSPKNENPIPIELNEDEKNENAQDPSLYDPPSSYRLQRGVTNVKRNMHRVPTIKIEKKVKNLGKFHEFLKESPANSKINFNIFEYIKLNFKNLTKFPLNEKEQLFTKGEKIYDEELDIVNILKKNQEVEKLKMVLFNEEQRVLFNLIDKPMIYVDDFDNLSYENCSAQLKMTKMLKSSKTLDDDNLKKIFFNMQKNQDLNPIDKRLMDLIDSNITAYVSKFVADE